MEYLDIIIVGGRYGITQELADLWEEKVSFKSDTVCGSSVKGERGALLRDDEGEHLAINASVISSKLPKWCAHLHPLELLEYENGIETKLALSGHPKGEVCSFMDKDGECILKSLKNDGVGHVTYGLQPSSCALYPLALYNKIDLVDVFGVSEHQIGDDFVLITLDILSTNEVTDYIIQGDTPLHELIANPLKFVLGTTVKDMVYKTVAKYRKDEQVGRLTLKLGNEMDLTVIKQFNKK